jgi:hypothetical protein
MYLLVARTNLLTYYFLGDRSMKTFTAFVLPDMAGSPPTCGYRRRPTRRNAT